MSARRSNLKPSFYSPPVSDGKAYDYGGTTSGPCAKMAIFQPSSPTYDQRVAIELASLNPGVQNFSYSLEEIFNAAIWNTAFDIASKVTSAKYEPLLASANEQTTALRAQLTELTASNADLNMQVSSLTAQVAQSSAMQASSAKQNGKLSQCVLALKQLLNSKKKVKAPSGC